MSNYDNSNQLVVFPNSYKEEGSKQPDYKGEGEFEGVKIKVSGWKNTSQNGKVYLKLRLERVEDVPMPIAATPAPRPKQAADDDIPF